MTAPTEMNAATSPARVNPAASAWLRLKATANITRIAVAAIRMSGNKEKQSKRVMRSSLLPDQGREIGFTLQIVHGRRESIEYRLRIQTQPQQSPDHGRDDECFTQREVRKLPALAVLPMEHALHHTKGIQRRRQNAEGRHDGDPHAERMEHFTRSAPDHYTVWQALRYGEVRGLGGCERMARELV